MRGRNQLRRLPNNLTSPNRAIKKLSLIKVLVTPTHSSAAMPNNLSLMMPLEAPFVALEQAASTASEDGGLTVENQPPGREICS